MSDGTFWCVVLGCNAATSHRSQPSHASVREQGAAVWEHQFLCTQCEGKAGEEGAKWVRFGHFSDYISGENIDS